MSICRPILIAMLALMLVGVSSDRRIFADDIPNVFNYTFDDVDPIKIYAGPVEFNHAGHVTTHGLTCNECHHTLEPGETEVEENCRDCHGEPGFIRGKEAEDVDWDELMEHYLNALHYQCIECHKAKLIENRDRKIPIGCTQCHDRSTLPLPE